MSRPRLIETDKFLRCRDQLIETEIFLGCQDRDSSRPGNLMDVETETTRDWAKDVDTETPSRLSLISDQKGVICQEPIESFVETLSIIRI